MLLQDHHADNRDPWWIPNHPRWLYPIYMLQTKYGDIYWLKVMGNQNSCVIRKLL